MEPEEKLPQDGEIARLEDNIRGYRRGDRDIADPGSAGGQGRAQRRGDCLFLGAQG